MSANIVFTLGLRHTFHLCQRGLALVQYPSFRHRSLRLGRCRKNLPLCEPSRLNPQLHDIETYEDLLQFLRAFVNCSDTPNYDFVGALHLLFAITENLATHSMDADFEGLDDGDFVLTDAQAAVLARLLELKPKT